jgi:hypothetical protein
VNATLAKQSISYKKGCKLKQIKVLQLFFLQILNFFLKHVSAINRTNWTNKETKIGLVTFISCFFSFESCKKKLAKFAKYLAKFAKYLAELRSGITGMIHPLPFWNKFEIRRQNLG